MTSSTNSTEMATRVFHSILIISGGAAGIAVAASLQARSRGLDIGIIEPVQNSVTLSPLAL